MKKCREEWQNTGLWTKIADRKVIIFNIVTFLYLFLTRDKAVRLHLLAHICGTAAKRRFRERNERVLRKNQGSFL